jgi:hypothetical protein
MAVVDVLLRWHSFVESGVKFRATADFGNSDVNATGSARRILLQHQTLATDKANYRDYLLDPLFDNNCTCAQ